MLTGRLGAGTRLGQPSGQWDSWTAGQLGTDRRGTAAAATQPKHHSPATGRVLRPWVVAWAVQMQWTLACVVARLLARLHASPKIDRSRDDRDRPSTGEGEGATRALGVLFLWCSAAALASYTTRRRIKPRASFVCAAVSRYCAHTAWSSRRVPCCPEPGLAISWLLVCAQFARSARHIRHSGPPYR